MKHGKRTIKKNINHLTYQASESFLKNLLGIVLTLIIVSLPIGAFLAFSLLIRFIIIKLVGFDFVDEKGLTVGGLIVYSAIGVFVIAAIIIISGIIYRSYYSRKFSQNNQGYLVISKNQELNSNASQEISDRNPTNKLTNSQQEKVLFDSNLAIDEFLLLKQIGFQPLGLVMGTATFETFPFTDTTADVFSLSDLLDATLSTALSRIIDSAKNLGADGIVDIKLENTKEFLEHGNTLTITLLGTAILLTNKSIYQSSKDKPFSTNLSSNELFALIKAGYRPLSLVMGSGADRSNLKSLKIRDYLTNCEIPEFTESFYKVRDIASRTLQAQALDLRAEGVISIKIVVNHEWGNSEEHNQNQNVLSVRAFLLGTAITKTEINADTSNIELTYETT